MSNREYKISRCGRYGISDNSELLKSLEELSKALKRIGSLFDGAVPVENSEPSKHEYFTINGGKYMSYEAVIQYIDRHYVHRVEAGNIDKLKEKCEPYNKCKNVYCITVNKLEYVGHIKADGLDIELL